MCIYIDIQKMYIYGSMRLMPGASPRGWSELVRGWSGVVFDSGPLGFGLVWLKAFRKNTQKNRKHPQKKANSVKIRQPNAKTPQIPQKSATNPTTLSNPKNLKSLQKSQKII